MKKCLDDIEVPARCYYYLLEWNERDNRKTMLELFGVIQLCLLESKQFWELFKIATETELKNCGKV